MEFDHVSDRGIMVLGQVTGTPTSRTARLLQSGSLRLPPFGHQCVKVKVKPDSEVLSSYKGSEFRC